MNVLYHLEHVNYAYTKKRPVLNIQQLNIAANSITALLGSNGSGKSTLLKLLAFLEHPQQGSIRFYDKDLTDTPHLSYRRCIGLVTQKPYLLRGTVFENVQLGLKFRGIPTASAKQQVAEALQRTGILTYANRQATDLSGGEAQKVALARALAVQPKVLLLDEPFTHLDQASIENLSQLIADFASHDGHSVIFSTHDHLLATTLADEVIGLALGCPVMVK